MTQIAIIALLVMLNLGVWNIAYNVYDIAVAIQKRHA